MDLRVLGVPPPCPHTPNAGEFCSTFEKWKKIRADGQNNENEPIASRFEEIMGISRYGLGDSNSQSHNNPQQQNNTSRTKAETILEFLLGSGSDDEKNNKTDINLDVQEENDEKNGFVSREKKKWYHIRLRTLIIITILIIIVCISYWFVNRIKESRRRRNNTFSKLFSLSPGYCGGVGQKYDFNDIISDRHLNGLAHIKDYRLNDIVSIRSSIFKGRHGEIENNNSKEYAKSEIEDIGPAPKTFNQSRADGDVYDMLSMNIVRSKRDGHINDTAKTVQENNLWGVLVLKNVDIQFVEMRQNNRQSFFSSFFSSVKSYGNKVEDDGGLMMDEREDSNDIHHINPLEDWCHVISKDRISSLNYTIDRYIIAYDECKQKSNFETIINHYQSISMLINDQKHNPNGSNGTKSTWIGDVFNGGGKNEVMQLINRRPLFSAGFHSYRKNGFKQSPNHVVKDLPPTIDDKIIQLWSFATIKSTIKMNKVSIRRMNININIKDTLILQKWHSCMSDEDYYDEDSKDDCLHSLRLCTIIRRLKYAGVTMKSVAKRDKTQVMSSMTTTTTSKKGISLVGGKNIGNNELSFNSSSSSSPSFIMENFIQMDVVDHFVSSTLDECSSSKSEKMSDYDINPIFDDQNLGYLSINASSISTMSKKSSYNPKMWWKKN